MVHRHTTSDEQLVKDVEGVLEDSCALIKGTAVSGQTDAMRSTFMLWDGICCYFEGRPKPASWIDQLMKAAKVCSAEARQLAADDAEVRYLSMMNVSHNLDTRICGYGRGSTVPHIHHELTGEGNTVTPITIPTWYSCAHGFSKDFREYVYVCLYRSH